VVNGGNCAAYDVNWVHYVHAAYLPRLSGRSAKSSLMAGAYRRAERKIVPNAQVVIANSKRTKDDLIRRVGVAEEKIRVVYYGCDGTRFRPATEAERVELRARLSVTAPGPLAVFVGSLGDHRKGFDVLFDAWRSLCRSASWDGTLLVVGRGAQLPYWRARAQSEGLSSRIAFLGFRTDVPDILRAVDVLVSPTRYEAYGLGVHEALCCGLPALVSASAGVAERYPVELRDLLLNDSESAAEVAAALTRWRGRQRELAEAVAPWSATLRAQTWDEMARGFVQAIGESSGR
jgi:glycosyltransferase involved in cell wall biosynthesis